MRIRLTSKFADYINGIRPSKNRAGEIINVRKRDAKVLIDHGWAELPQTKDNRAEVEVSPPPISTPTIATVQSRILRRPGVLRSEALDK